MLDTFTRWTGLLVLGLATAPASVQPPSPARRVPPSALQTGFARLSPFTAVRMRGAVAEVRYEGTWYELVELDGIAAERILAYSKQAFGSRWEKRFAEDLVQVLAGMEHEVGEHVSLVLIELATKKRREVARAPMTEQNRNQVRDARNAEPATSPPRPARAHAETPAPEYAFLAEPNRLPAPRDEPRIPRAGAEQDLDQLEGLLEQRFAYRDLTGVDWRAALDAIRCALPEAVGRSELALRLAKLLALAGDGHSGLDEDVGALVSGGCAPFLIGDVGTALVAFTPARDGFVDPQRPRLVALDGVPLERWLAAAANLVARGSPAVARFRALRLLRHIELLRSELGLPASKTVALELAALDGSKAKTRELRLSAEKPVYGVWPRGEHRELDGNVGYLRLAEMEDSPGFLDALDAAMERFRDTRGLVIDVRGNGGGRRDALLRLFPYFLGPDEGPYVANVAAYRLEPGERADLAEGYLADRYLWPLTAQRFGPAERSAIAAAAARFRPSWTPPAADFSAWHWLVLAREANPRAYAYRKPLVILLDGGCFSATDVFLAAFAGRPGVTLLGTPSSGGSGRARGFRLANSGIGVRLSSMASFRPDGRAYDGSGIEPDVLVQPAAEDFLGRGDAQLAAALARLRE